MNDYSAVPPEFLAYAMGLMKAEEQPKVDLWAEIQELARVDPACRNAVDAVRYGRATKEEAALWLALTQTKRAMELHERAVELLRLTPMPPIWVPAGQWSGPVAHEGPAGAPE